jgi:hypothetical protein
MERIFYRRSFRALFFIEITTFQVHNINCFVGIKWESSRGANT